MTDVIEDFDQELREAAVDIQSFIAHCSSVLGQAERGFISTMAQYMTLAQKYLVQRKDAESKVSWLDILESQIDALRKCLIDLEGSRKRLLEMESAH